MTTLTVRDVDQSIVDQLRLRAARNGRSAEAEHRAILATVLARLSPVSDDVIAKLADYRDRTSHADSPSSTELLREARATRTEHFLKGEKGD